jgi:hypothetical protein
MLILLAIQAVLCLVVLMHGNFTIVSRMPLFELANLKLSR